ncbi:MAG TPA: YhbY family RNA-binding protein [Clostridia bacterium]|nr:YhbY family RNA-binding protein [Clostridia bacterium]
MTGKQRAKLKSMANTTPALYQIGKGGITPEVQEQLDAALEARELIKATVLESCPVSAKEALSTLSERLRAEPVQSIGRKITLYRRSKENPKIELD